MNTMALLIGMVTSVVATVVSLATIFKWLIDARFGSVEARFGSVDARFGAVDSRFDAVDQRLTSIEADLHLIKAHLIGQASSS